MTSKINEFIGTDKKSVFQILVQPVFAESIWNIKHFHIYA